MKPARAGAVALALLAAAAPAGAQSLRWSDFRDPRPGVASSTPAGTGPRTGGFTTSGGARLRLVQRDDGVEAWVDNPLAGPVEAMLHADEAVPGSDPPLPARGTVPAARRAAHAAASSPSCEMTISRYTSHVRSSSSWVPRPTMRPSSSTMI